jgi:NAD(P)-dependent dehydrogenase (short-subunit alcohol dehydrogenase family)
MTGPVKGWALITGAGKRLGRACAVALARDGYGIAAHYNSSGADAEALAQEVIAGGGSAVALQADLSDAAAASGLIDAFAARHAWPMTVLVNSASLFEFDTLQTFTVAEFERHMRVNTLSPLILMQTFAAALPEERGGVIINFLDYKLVQPYPDHFTYTLSKYALMGATELAARGLAPRIRVNAVAPGYVLPGINQSDADFERLHGQTPLGRGATAEDVASAVMLLVSNPALTAQTIYVDAGLRFRSVERDFSFQ